VLLYAKTAFKTVTQAPEWAGGLYDGKIRIPVGGLTTAEEAVGLQSVLVHEMTHAFLFRMAPVGLPLWFNEGLATAFQGWDVGKIRAWFSEHPPRGSRRWATSTASSGVAAGTSQRAMRRPASPSASSRRCGALAPCAASSPGSAPGDPSRRSSGRGARGYRRVRGPLAPRPAVTTAQPGTLSSSACGSSGSACP